MYTFDYSSLKKPNISACRINSISKIRNAKLYLEIGVWKGDTFINVVTEKKFAVEPSFQFDLQQYKDNENLHFFKMTSDDFFKLLDKGTQKIKFDIIFIDGLHTFKQSLTDFQNSLHYSHDDTVWILDDTIPYSPYTALSDQKLSERIHSLQGLKGRPWHGDVYKTLFYIHDNFMDFSYCSLLDHAQTVLWKTRQPQNRTKIFNSVQGIERATFFDVLANAAKFNPVPEHLLLECIGTNMDISYDHTVWESFIPKIAKTDLED